MLPDPQTQSSFVSLDGVASPRPRAPLRIGDRGDYVGVGASTIDLRRRGPLRRIVLALAQQQHREPGKALSVTDMFAAGWPEQKVSPRAAAARVYTAMYTLRRMGLRSVLIRRDDGYVLDERCEF